MQLVLEDISTKQILLFGRSYIPTSMTLQMPNRSRTCEKLLISQNYAVGETKTWNEYNVEETAIEKQLSGSM